MQADPENFRAWFDNLYLRSYRSVADIKHNKYMAFILAGVSQVFLRIDHPGVAWRI
jgi:hypothetical protein